MTGTGPAPAREAARRHDGRFGAQPRPESGLDLDEPVSDPACQDDTDTEGLGPLICQDDTDTEGLDHPACRGEPDDQTRVVLARARAYCDSAGGARRGMCFPASWNIHNEFGWPIVSGVRGGVTHFWNESPDGSFWLDATAGQFGDEGPQVIEPEDPRYSMREYVTPR